VPLVVALNRVDLAERRGLRIDAAHLSRHLGCPVVPMTATRGEGAAELWQALHEVADTHRLPAAHPLYDPALEAALASLAAGADDAARQAGVHPRWLAVKRLERDLLAIRLTPATLAAAAEEAMQRLTRQTGLTAERLLLNGRLGFAAGLTRATLTRRAIDPRYLSDLIDRVLLSRLAGPALFLGVMYLVFALTVRLTQPLVDFLDLAGSALLIQGPSAWLTRWGLPALPTALLTEGIGSGVVAVATFLPPIAAIFVCLSLLEESGYMARAAFLMDRLMCRIGLPGKAFIPLLVGFGCTVPALMATRTLEARRERILTMLLTPFMSCGARLPVYTLFAFAFFPRHGAQIVFALYLAGVALAILSGLLLHRTLLRGTATDFVMDLPPYQLPPLRGCLRHLGYNLKSFIVRAGKVIVAISLGLCLLNRGAALWAQHAGAAAAPRPIEAAGRLITPLLAPMGVDADNWPASVGLLTGLLAKESVVATLELSYAQQHDRADEPFLLGAALRQAWQALRDGFAPPDTATPADEPPARPGMLAALRDHFHNGAAAFAYLLFVLIYSPCLAALVVLEREAGWRWMLFSVGYQTLLAWLTATLFYQAATAGLGSAPFLAWAATAAGVLTALTVALRAVGGRLAAKAAQP
jgi:ferrous iron transport protein B